jgi:glucose-1-phosphate adenylyltransferase
VFFGGKYRIIDFVLSNCSNSGIDTVGVLTQYQPLVLNSHIGIGSPWDLDRKKGGVSLLPPYVKEKGGEWYKGTANAIYQNINFIDMHSPDYVVVLSGDHIYKMDYSKMLDYHKEKSADATIAVIEVPWDETDRFGIMNTEPDDRIYEFDEKPKKAKSNLASMGIYIFNWAVLRKYLVEDEADPASSNDFGKNIIPQMLKDQAKLFAYPFSDYWKDVGTIESLWEANMDLLKEDNKLNLFDPKWKIYSVNPIRPPHYMGDTAVIKDSMVGEGCIIYGEVINSVLFPGVCVGKGTKIIDTVVMPKVFIGENVTIERTIIGHESIINNDCRIGDSSSKAITLVGEYEQMAEGTVRNS